MDSLVALNAVAAPQDPDMEQLPQNDDWTPPTLEWQSSLESDHGELESDSVDGDWASDLRKLCGLLHD